LEAVLHCIVAFACTGKAREQELKEVRCVQVILKGEKVHFVEWIMELEDEHVCRFGVRILVVMAVEVAVGQS